MRWIVFVPTVFRRIVRRRNDDAVRQAIVPPLIVSQDRTRDDRSGRITGALVDHDIDAIGREHLDGACQRRLGERVCVNADKERARNTGFGTVVTDCLGRR